jgi:hypothetical protein
MSTKRKMMKLLTKTKLIMGYMLLSKGGSKTMKCWLLAVGGLGKFGIKVELITLLEFSMTILRSTKRLLNITKSFCKFVKALVIAMVKL